MSGLEVHLKESSLSGEGFKVFIFYFVNYFYVLIPEKGNFKTVFGMNHGSDLSE
jgi:hypothetical protein